MNKKDESVTLKILRKMYPYYDKDYDVDIMDILKEYYNDLLDREKDTPLQSNTFKEEIPLLKVKERCLRIASTRPEEGLVILGGYYNKLGSPLTDIGKAQSFDKSFNLDNIPSPIKGYLTKSGYLYIKEIIESEKRTRIERKRFYLTAGIAATALICTTLQTYTTVSLNNQQIELRIKQSKVSRIVDSLQELQKSNHITKP